MVGCLLSACIPLPVITPPVRVGFTPGVGGGPRPEGADDDNTASGARRVNATSAGAGSLSPTAEETDVPPDHPLSGVLGVVVGIHPGQLFESFLSRSWDVGLGYRFEHFLGSHLDAPDLHGLYLEGAYFFHTSPPGSDAAFRVGALAQGDVLFADPDPQGDAGWGASGGVILELSTFTGGAAPQDVGDSPSASSAGDPPATESSDVSSTGFYGVAFGELGIGLSATGGFRQVAGRDLWVALFSLHVRLPVLAGVALVPITEFFDD